LSPLTPIEYGGDAASQRLSLSSGMALDWPEILVGAALGAVFGFLLGFRWCGGSELVGELGAGA
jgi:hypothetical protein